MKNRRHPNRRSNEERDKLVTQWIGLPVFVVNRLKTFLAISNVSDDDAKQNGMLGLIRAAELFDETRGFEFSTYATHSIRHFIVRAVQEQGGNGPIRVATHAWKSKNKAVKKDARMAKRAVYLSYFGKRVHPVREYPPDDESDKEIALAMKSLPFRSLHVIIRRFWDNKSLNDIGEELGISKERVRQIQREAIDTMRPRITPL